MEITKTGSTANYSLTTAEASLITAYRLLPRAAKGLAYSYLDRLAIQEAVVGDEPSVPREQHLAFIVPVNPQWLAISGIEPKEPVSSMLALVSAAFDKAAVYELTENGPSLSIVAADQDIIQGVLEGALAALDAIPTVEAETLAALHQKALTGILPLAYIPM